MKDFLGERIPGAPNFKWQEALYLPQWNIHVYPTEEQTDNILALAHVLQKIRVIVNAPMMVQSWVRPPKYNVLIGGAEFSWHMTGGACDFRCPGISGDELREIIKPHLETLNIRMEDLPGASWVHVDNKETNGARFFKP